MSGGLQVCAIFLAVACLIATIVFSILGCTNAAAMKRGPWNETEFYYIGLTASGCEWYYTEGSVDEDGVYEEGYYTEYCTLYYISPATSQYVYPSLKISYTTAPAPNHVGPAAGDLYGSMWVNYADTHIRRSSPNSAKWWKLCGIALGAGLVFLALAILPDSDLLANLSKQNERRKSERESARQEREREKKAYRAADTVGQTIMQPTKVSPPELEVIPAATELQIEPAVIAPPTHPVMSADDIAF